MPKRLKTTRKKRPSDVALIVRARRKQSKLKKQLKVLLELIT